jgi:hypothetical protein
MIKKEDVIINNRSLPQFILDATYKELDKTLFQHCCCEL